MSFSFNFCRYLSSILRILKICACKALFCQILKPSEFWISSMGVKRVSNNFFTLKYILRWSILQISRVIEFAGVLKMIVLNDGKPQRTFINSSGLVLRSATAKQRLFWGWYWGYLKNLNNLKNVSIAKADSWCFKIATFSPLAVIHAKSMNFERSTEQFQHPIC